MARGRTLYFQQTTDSRFEKREDCLPILQDRINRIKKLLDIEGLDVYVGEPYLLEWGNKEDENKIPLYYTEKPKFDTDYYNIQYRADFQIRKNTRKLTWDDIYGLINSVKAVPYKFI